MIAETAPGVRGTAADHSAAAAAAARAAVRPPREPAEWSSRARGQGGPTRDPATGGARCTATARPAAGVIRAPPGHISLVVLCRKYAGVRDNGFTARG